MAEIVQFGRKPAGADEPPKPPQLVGIGHCRACRHEWEASAELGTTILKCPSCYRWFGVWKSAVEPDVAWYCKCGNNLFFLTIKGAMCMCCGLVSNQWAE